MINFAGAIGRWLPTGSLAELRVLVLSRRPVNRLSSAISHHQRAGKFRPEASPFCKREQLVDAYYHNPKLR